MNKYIRPDRNYLKKRWVAYLDLLGSKSIALNNRWEFVFTHYQSAIKSFTRGENIEPKVEKLWFSDTFIIYGPDDTAASFTTVHSNTHNFFIRLVQSGKPVRGAIACDEFYADKENNIYFGKALIEAHRYGENVNLITFVIAPTAERRMGEVGLDPKKRLNYAYCDVPYKKQDGSFQKQLPVYVVGSPDTINGQPILLNELKGLMHGVEDEKDREKYQNTLDFAEKRLKSMRTI